MLVLITIFSTSLALGNTGSNIRPEAKVAGYHQHLYTDILRNVGGYSYINVEPGLIIQGTPGLTVTQGNVNVTQGNVNIVGANARLNVRNPAWFADRAVNVRGHSRFQENDVKMELVSLNNNHAVLDFKRATTSSGDFFGRVGLVNNVIVLQNSQGGSPPSYPIHISASGSADIILDPGTGRVGVGSASSMNPTQKLDVDGKIRMRVQTVSTDAGDIVVTKGYLDTVVSTLESGISGVEGSRWSAQGDDVYRADGNVFIGSAPVVLPPTQPRLYVAGNIMQTGADFVMSAAHRGPGGRALVHHENNVLAINYAADFNSTLIFGNLGIGVDDPKAILHLKGQVEGFCSGTPRSCSDFDFTQPGCANQAGCSWSSGDCLMVDPFNCDSYNGCTLSLSSGCTGAPGSGCDAYSDSFTCQMYHGCSWNTGGAPLCEGTFNSCQGTPTTCTGLSQTQCNTQQGCGWNTIGALFEDGDVLIEEDLIVEGTIFANFKVATHTVDCPQHPDSSRCYSFCPQNTIRTGCSASERGSRSLNPTYARPVSNGCFCWGESGTLHDSRVDCHAYCWSS